MDVKRKRIAGVFALCMAVALAALVALSGCASSGSVGSGTLKVGVRSDIVGFGYYNEETGNYYGLEIDIAEEMASRLGYSDVEYVTVTPDTRKDMLLNGEVDCLIACYSISESREENFDFSPAYYEDAIIMVTENTSYIDSIDDLNGCTIGTMSGANTAPQLAIKLAEIGFSNGEVQSANEDNSDVQFDTYHLLQFSSYQELSNALEEGTVDAMVMDGAIAKTYMNSERSIMSDFTIEDQSYGVATQKDSELSSAVSETIQEMLDDGTIAALIDKWD